MDEYLEGLVKKTATPEVEDNIAVAEETATVAEEPAAVAEKAVAEEPAAVAEKAVAEEPVAEKAVAEEPVAVAEEKPVKAAKSKTASSSTSKVKLVLDAEYDVNSVRVYRTPDIRQASKIISGKVIYLGKSGTFSIIKYMRHGFGLVKGYVNDLESALK